MEELKRCPFCGAVGRIRDMTIEEQGSVANGNFYKMCGCPNYCVEMFGRTEEEAIKRWNRRAYDEKTEAEWVLTDDKYAEMSCSRCGFKYYGEFDEECMSAYCPDCGARMINGEEEWKGDND